MDLLLPETAFDTLNLKAALFAIARYFDETGRRRARSWPPARSWTCPAAR